MTVSLRGAIAEHLETLLFICPRCGAMHRMVSSGDRFFCGECGYEVTLSAHGLFRRAGRGVRQRAGLESLAG
jgi:ribosomal protein S27AE